MRLRGRRKSENVIDVGGGDARPPGGVGKKAALGGGLGIILIAVVTLMNGGSLGDVLGQVANQAAQSGGNPAGAPAQPAGDVQANSPEEQEALDFISRVLATTEDVWDREFPRQFQKGAYERPLLHRFRDGVNSGCGYQTEQVGPFYCGADRGIYLDLTFFTDLARKYNAAGDFAQAYVVAHEVGHHIQQISEVSAMVRAQKRSNPRQENQWSVRQELHADFLAGMWGHYVEAQGLLDRGDLEEALNAAAQIGDDTLQKRATGRVQPDGFTHGTAAQRRRWFLRGFETGDLSAGEDLFRLPYAEL